MARKAPSPCALRHLVTNLACVSNLKFKDIDMGLTIWTFAGAFRVARQWFTRRAAPAARPSSAAGTHPRFLAGGLHTGACRAHVSWPQHGRSPARHRPLRVLRVVDAAQGSSTAGRMVISGRMADVCAELDRLVALEALAAA